MTKVLLVGAGERAQSAILPALWELRDSFQLVGVAARSKKQLSLMGGKWQIAVTDSLEDFNFQEIDIIMVAITLQNVPIVVAQLASRPVSHITLMLDTPVLPPTGLGALKNFSYFKKVVVMEDNLYLPLYQQVKADIEAGKIGRVKKIIFLHSGYRYHALAVLRFLTGAQFIKKIKVLRLPGKQQKREINLPSGIKAEMVEPRNYEIGQFIVEGERGTLNYDLKKFGDMREMKTLGLKDLIIRAASNTFDFSYSARDAIYDNLALKVSDKFGLFFDFRIGNYSLFRWLLQLF